MAIFDKILQQIVSTNRFSFVYLHFDFISFPFQSKYILFLWVTIRNFFTALTDKQPQNFCGERQHFWHQTGKNGNDDVNI